MNDQLSIFEESESKMTLLEISRSLDVTGKTVRKYVDKLFPGKMQNGKATFLNEAETTLVKMELEKNQHLNRSVELPKTELEENLIIQQAQNLLNARIENLQNQLKEAQPKIEFHDAVGNSEGLYSIGVAAKMLGTGRNKFFGYLRDEDIFFHRQPYQTFIDRGYFEVKTVHCNGKNRFQSFVTGNGLQWLQKRFT